MQDLLKDILKRCEGAAKDFVKEEAEAFLKEGAALGKSISGDLEKWTKAFHEGKIDEAGLKRLLKRKQTALEMQAIKHAAIAEIRMEQLQNQMLDIVISSVSAAL
jgi:hypothetical protein